MITAATHLDEIESRAKHLGDMPQEAILVMVPYLHGIGAFGLWCTVAHLDGRIFHTAFPDGWRETMRGHGYPDDESAERLIESLAWIEFLRRIA